MQQKRKGEPPCGEAATKAESDNWADDQKKHSYYYDDGHGYEVFDRADDAENDDEDQAAP